jgi:hypothetical protein
MREQSRDESNNKLRHYKYEVYCFIYLVHNRRVLGKLFSSKENLAVAVDHIQSRKCSSFLDYSKKQEMPYLATNHLW